MAVSGHALTRFADGLQRLAAVVPELTPVLRRLPSPSDSVGDYCAIRQAMAEITVLASELADHRVAAWLVADETVLTVMAAAAAVLEADGLPVDRGRGGRDDVAGYRRRAVRWRAYSRGPVSELHRDCAQDLSRGWLRLLSRPPRLSDPRLELQRARVELIRQARRRCAGVRAALLAECAAGRRGFVPEARTRLVGEFAAIEAACGSQFGGTQPGRRWRLPEIPEPVPALRRDEMCLGAVLGVGFGLGAALGASRLLTGLAGLPEPTGAVAGLVAGLALTLWVVGLRVRLQRRVAVERWVTEAVALVRQAAEEELTCWLLEVQTRTSRIGKLADSEIAGAVTGR